MYSPILLVHSWLRYAVLALGIALVVAAVQAARGGWTPGHERVHKAFIGLLDLQLLLGLVLFFTSPIVAQALADFGAAMKDPQLRFFGVEHPFTMLIAVIVAHVARARSRRGPGGARPRLLLWTQLVWLLLTALAIPWPGLDVGRPLWR